MAEMCLNCEKREAEIDVLCEECHRNNYEHVGYRGDGR